MARSRGVGCGSAIGASSPMRSASSTCGPGDVANIIDVRSQVRPTDWDLRIGPCRHGYFTIRVADHLRVVDRKGDKVGGKLTASGGRVGEKEIRWQLGRLGGLLR